MMQPVESPDSTGTLLGQGVPEPSDPDTVSVVAERLPGSLVGLTIQLPQAQVDAAFERVLSRLTQRAKIGGFRPGKAPRELVEARLGTAAIREEVIETLVPQAVTQALRERAIEAIERPRVEIDELERGRPARLRARVSVMPDVKLPDVASLHVERSRTAVDDEMVERRLRELREQLAEIEPVEREARLGDVVIADLEVSVEGKEVESERRTAMEMELREGVLLPELLTELQGKQGGQQAVAEVAMPDDHANPELRGRTARLQVAVQGVKEKRVPELTDEVAAQLSNGEQETAAKLESAVRQDLIQQGERLDQLAFEQATIKALVEASQVEVPPALVDREVERQVEELQQRLGQQGLRLDRYMEYLNTSLPEYTARLRPDAESRIKVDLVLEELGKQLAIDPADAEVEDHIRQEAAKDAELQGQLDSLLSNAVARDYFKHRLTRLRILETLVERVAEQSAVKKESGG